MLISSYHWPEHLAKVVLLLKLKIPLTSRLAMIQRSTQGDKEKQAASSSRVVCRSDNGARRHQLQLVAQCIALRD